MLPFGFALQMDTRFGAGLTTLNLLTHLALQKQVFPVLLLEPGEVDVDPWQGRLLHDLLTARQNLLGGVDLSQGVALDMPVMVPVGNGFQLPESLAGFRGKKQIAKVVFENTTPDPQAWARLNAYDGTMVVSQFCRHQLEQNGVNNVHMVPQGVDRSLFHPAPKVGYWNDRFVVFSAGKLEYRKGQDLVIEAFKRFHARHNDALLVFAWHNFWPQSIKTMEASTYTAGLPIVDEKGNTDFQGWLELNGLPKGSFLNLGFIHHHRLASVMREVNVALFPNRCEGGTNLMAMETMSCGVPTILSANTGHLDIIGDHCSTLSAQRDVSVPAGHPSGEGWGESDVDEMVVQLEMLYSDSEKAKRLSQASVTWAESRDWSVCAKAFVDEMAVYLS